MSNPNKYVEDIKRIAKDDDLKGALLSQADKEFIEGALNPFVFNLNVGTSSDSGTGDGTGGTTTTNGEETQDNTNETDPNDPNTFNKGGGSTSQTTTQTGVQDLESVMDGEAGPQAGDDSQNSEPSSPTGSLTGLTGATDCSTTQCVNLHLDGQFPPPDGWDDADSPPEDDGYIYGRNWEFDGDLYPSHSAVWSVYVPWWDSVHPGFHITGVTSIVESGTQVTYFFERERESDGQIAPQEGTFSSGICTPSESDPSCPLTAPTETEWPTDGCYDLALIDGTFQANQYDSEVPANAGGSSVDICFGTDRFATVYVTANGGTMVVETATAGGTPSGTTYVYAADGTLQYSGDSSSTNHAQYLPK